MRGSLFRHDPADYWTVTRGQRDWKEENGGKIQKLEVFKLLTMVLCYQWISWHILLPGVYILSGQCLLNSTTKNPGSSQVAMVISTPVSYVIFLRNAPAHLAYYQAVHRIRLEDSRCGQKPA